MNEGDSEGSSRVDIRDTPLMSSDVSEISSANSTRGRSKKQLNSPSPSLSHRSLPKAPVQVTAKAPIVTAKAPIVSPKEPIQVSAKAPIQVAPIQVPIIQNKKKLHQLKSS